MSGKHHHTHKMDDATRFKHNSLRSLRRRKIIAKWCKFILLVVAILMVLATIVVYIID